MYADALEKLFAVARRAGLPFTARESLSDDTKVLVNRIFGQSQASLIFEHGYPSGMHIPLSAGTLRIYSLFDLNSRQLGYRQNANTAEIELRWDQSYWVVADKSSDPVTISEYEKTVSYAVHGTGNWRMISIARDLRTFCDVMSTWIEFFLIRNQRDIFDDDCVITPNNRRELQELLGNISGFINVSEVISFITE